jgi:hypothetical protein
MTERWQRELEKLGGVDAPVSRMRARMASGPLQDPQGPEPGRSAAQRITAGVVAFAIFAAAGVFAYRALEPSAAAPRAVATPVFTISASRIPDATPSASGVVLQDLQDEFSAVFKEGDVSITDAAATVCGFSAQCVVPPPTPFDIALTSGSHVHLEATNATIHVELLKANGGNTDTVIEADGSILPDPGHYSLSIEASSDGVSAFWTYAVDIEPPGTVQVYSPTGRGIAMIPNDQVDVHNIVPPDIELLIDGRLYAGENTPVGGPYTDPTGPRPQIRNGSPVWVSPNVTEAFISLTARNDATPIFEGTSFDEQRAPGLIGTVDLTPGDYWFAAYADNNSAELDIAFPVTVLTADGSLPTPSPSPPMPAWKTVAVNIATTSGTSDCPGGPEGTLAYGGRSTKGFGTSYSWECVGSGMSADTKAPAFADSDFVQVPVGAQVAITGDFSSLGGEILDYRGAFPWESIQSFGYKIDGAVLTLDPGRYVVDITAHWPNGDRRFLFPIELTAGTSPTPAASFSGEPNVLEISCDGGVPSAVDRTVAVQADGLHIRMAGQAPPNEQLAFYGRDDFYLSTGTETFSSGSYSGEFTRAAATGIYDVKCFQQGINPNTLNAAAAVDVVDPNGYWVSTDLGCPRGDWAALRERAGEYATQEAAVQALGGVLPSDTVEPAGYTQDPSNATWRVTRGGNVVAWTGIFGSSGSWAAGHGVGCVSAGTGDSGSGSDPSTPGSNAPTP